MNVCMYVCMYVCLSVCIYIYIYMYTHYRVFRVDSVCIYDDVFLLIVR